MRSWAAIGVCAAAVAFAWTCPAAAGMDSGDSSALKQLQLLDVPFVPQGEALCGGAALAMVLRYWGRPGVLAEDFAPLVEPEQAGIRTGALVKAVKDRGWAALPLLGTSAGIQDQLALGRPVIALIRAGSNSYHYVVLVAWTKGWVIIHDPKSGPFRAIREGKFDNAWSGSGRWALLALPPAGAPEQHVPAPAAAAAPPAPAADGCGAMVDAGILLAQQGDTAEAELRFLAAESLCPESAAALRERAGLRFRAQDWTGAGRLAERAVALDPDDAHAWRLLAGCRFLTGDVEGALHAWNHLAEPRADLTRIDGLTRIRYSAVTGQLDLPPGQLLTPDGFRRARRRLADLPAQSESRLSLKPLADGSAQLNVALLERPRVFDGPWGLGSAGLQALTRREITLDVASPTGNGELWTAAWRWWKNRPRVSLALAAPAPGGRPGIWRVEGSWEIQTYAHPAPSRSTGTAAGISREERRRSALSYSDWLGPDLRLQVGTALDEWNDRGSFLAVEGGVETRWARDRLKLGAEAARWTGLNRGAPFGAGSLSLQWSSRGLESREAWQGLLGVSGATSEAPLALWSGAGTGCGRAPLLRAHPLLNGGIVEGHVFGRTLVHGMIEKQAWPWTLGPLRLGWALFVDTAKPWETVRAERIGWQVDAGAGLRLQSLGVKGQFRIDAARGLADGTSAVSIDWRIP